MSGDPVVGHVGFRFPTFEEVQEDLAAFDLNLRVHMERAQKILVLEWLLAEARWERDAARKVAEAYRDSGVIRFPLPWGSAE